MARPEPRDIHWFESPAALRAWLESDHATAPELWVGLRPMAAGQPTITWHQLVDEVLCFGWIDGVRMPADGGSCIRITPRRGGSIWSARNVGRVEALRAEGRMRPAGLAAFAQRRDDRTAIYSFEVNQMPLSVLAKWTHEFAARNTFSGDTASAAISFKF